ncbi:MAG: hypothetical protein M1831_000187 [Alyxoria varia]|nr:MAG: hypothetical protein M1831_000187 [Alyxoria varia]
MSTIMQTIITFVATNLLMVKNAVLRQPPPPSPTAEPHGFWVILWSYMNIVPYFFELTVDMTKYSMWIFFQVNAPTLFLLLAVLCLFLAALWHQFSMNRRMLAKIQSYSTELGALSSRATINTDSIVDSLMRKLRGQQAPEGSIANDPANLSLSDDLRQHLDTLTETIKTSILGALEQKIKENIGASVESMPTATQFKDSMKVSIVKAVQDEIKDGIENRLDSKLETHAAHAQPGAGDSATLAKIQRTLVSMSTTFVENNKKTEHRFQSLQMDISHKERENADLKKEVPDLRNQLKQSASARDKLKQDSNDKIAQLEARNKRLEQEARDEKEATTSRDAAMQAQKAEASRQLDLERNNSAHLAEQLDNCVAALQDPQGFYRKLAQQVETLERENAALRKGMSPVPNASHGPTTKGSGPKPIHDGNHGPSAQAPGLKRNGGGLPNGNSATSSQSPRPKPNGGGLNGSRPAGGNRGPPSQSQGPKPDGAMPNASRLENGRPSRGNTGRGAGHGDSRSAANGVGVAHGSSGGSFTVNGGAIGGSRAPGVPSRNGGGPVHENGINGRGAQNGDPLTWTEYRRGLQSRN